MQPIPPNMQNLSQEEIQRQFRRMQELRAQQMQQHQASQSSNSQAHAHTHEGCSHDHGQGHGHSHSGNHSHGRTHGHGQGHSHGDSHGHGHGQGHAPHSGPCNHNHGGPHRTSREQQQQHNTYFREFENAYKTNRLFFWNEILNGSAKTQFLNKLGLRALNKIDLSIVKQIIGGFLGFATVDCLPLCLRPFFAGLFIPLFVYLYITYRYLLGAITQTTSPASAKTELVSLWYLEYLHYLYLIPVLFLSLAGLRGSGSPTSQELKCYSASLIIKKPFLKNPKAICQICDVIKGFRTQHCAGCKICVAKFSFHSILMNECVGAANELLYMFGMLGLSFTICVSMVLYILHSPGSSVTSQIIYLLLNLSIGWIAFVQGLSIFILNIWYNCTEFELKTWIHQSYLLAFMKREFFNANNMGPFYNFKESLYCLLGVEEAKDQQNSSAMSEVSLSDSIKPEHLAQYSLSHNKTPRVTNWCKVSYIYAYEIPNHPHKKQAAEKIAEMETSLMAQFKAMAQVRKRVEDKYLGKASQDEIERYVMMEMQMEAQKMRQAQMQKMMKMQQQQQQEAKRREAEKAEAESKESSRLLGETGGEQQELVVGDQ